MANVIRKWKRFLSIGCNHGHLHNPDVVREALALKKKWNPHRTIHLGDNWDTAAFRGGAAGTKDEGVSLSSDLNFGLEFVRKLEPTDFINGNHDDRLWQNQDHWNAIKAAAASLMVRDIEKLLGKLRCNHVKEYNISRQCWVQLGDTKFLHGYLYNEQAMRDHAEHFGRCVIAHLHKVGSAPGRRIDLPRCYCVGTLADVPAMGYAKTRRATSQWSHGIAYGEYSDKECMVWLAERSPSGTWNWRP